MAQLSIFYNRANQLADAMRLCQDDLVAYGAAAALLAVHSAISYCDAVLIGLVGARSKDESHHRVIGMLRRACNTASIDTKGITHLQRLIGAKTDISYGDRPVDNDKTLALCAAAERFQAWAEQVLKSRRGRS